jgi:hypothetical protein
MWCCWLVCLLQAEEDAAARISDLQSTLEVCQADADDLRELLVQAELQCREAERQAAIATAAGGQHRCVLFGELGGSLVEGSQFGAGSNMG